MLGACKKYRKFSKILLVAAFNSSATDGNTK